MTAHDTPHTIEPVVIGDATLYCGDCLEILPTLQKVDAVVTDPPYGTGGWRRLAAGAGSNPAASLVCEEWVDGDTAWLACGAWPVITFWAPARMPQLMAAIGQRGKVRMLYMRKLDPKPQFSGRIAWSIEPVIVASGDGFQLYGGTDLIDASAPRKGRDACATGHQYQKPLAVMKWLVGKIRANVICDPFMGSGTTGVACMNLGRKFIGIEIDPHWFGVACRRIEDAQRQGRLFA